MQPLEKALYSHELIVLRVIGEWWELELTGSDKAACVKALAQTLAGLDMTLEVGYLGPEEAAAFNALVAGGGRLPVASFERQYGEVRLMGPGRLEREEPWFDPISPAEGLWYRGLIYRAFDEAEDGQLVEYYFLPDELAGQFPKPAAEATSVQEQPRIYMTGRPAPEEIIQANTHAVDDITALLSSAQNSPLPIHPQSGDTAWLVDYLLDADPTRLSLLLNLAWEINFLRETPEGARPARASVDWLKLGRERQLVQLAEAWSGSVWNELCHTPGLACEGSGWKNDPLLARTALLDALPRSGEWFRLEDLVSRLREEDPDFQRPGGNYETWYISDLETGDFLSGFENWDRVEGRLLHFLIQGPMYWLGLVTLSANRELYALTELALNWLAGNPVAEEDVFVPIVVQDDASMLVPYNSNRYFRFQAARISEAEPVEADKPFSYRLTPRSLAQAKEQGIDLDRVLKFMAKASGRPVPPSTRRAVERWSERGTEGRLEQVVILRVRDAEILQKLRENPKTRSFMGEALGDLAVVVRQEEWRELRRAAAQLGLLLDVIE